MTVTLKNPETGLEWETDHLPSRLLSLAVSSDYGGEIYTEDDAVSITAFERSLNGHWYDQFVQMYQDGKNLDALASELDDEIEQLLSRATDRIRREGEIVGALQRLDALEKGRLSPPNRDTIVDPPPMTESERESLLRDIVGDLNAYPHLSPDHWQDIETIRSVGERFLERVQDELHELRHEYHFLTWRKALLEQATTNCRWYGDFRRWQEFREGPQTEAEEESEEPKTSIKSPPDDLFEGRGTKPRKKAESYARDLARLFVDKEEEIPVQWSALWSKLEERTSGQPMGRNRVQRVRKAFEDHPQAGEPSNPEELCEACYHFFSDITITWR